MTTPTAVATGRKEIRDGVSWLVYTRTFHAPAEDVWAALTEPDRLERWIGTWTGDPASGKVTFRMTAEGEDAPDGTVWIDTCQPPTRLVTRLADDAGPEWHIELQLSEETGTTTLTFRQAMDDPAVAENVGPGWDYYLDRLLVAHAGGDAAAVNWDDYYPGLAGSYREAFA